MFVPAGIDDLAHRTWTRMAHDPHWVTSRGEGYAADKGVGSISEFKSRSHGWLSFSLRTPGAKPNSQLQKK